MTVLAPIEDRKLAAIGLIVAALLGFSGIDTCAKWLVLHGMATPEVVFVRYFGHLALVVGLALPFGERILRTRNLGDDPAARRPPAVQHRPQLHRARSTCR